MRSRTSHAAKSGVGEHTARESEAPNVCDGSVLDGKGVLPVDNSAAEPGNLGVKITIDREVGYDSAYPRGK
jgi:hypothetical protein